MWFITSKLKHSSSKMDPAAAAAPDAAAPGAVPQPVAPVLTAFQKRMRSITPDQERVSAQRQSLIGKELDRRSGLGQHVPPHIPPESRIDRGVAAYGNGANVKGLRVLAYNTVTHQWKRGEISHVAVQAPRGQGHLLQTAKFVIAIVKHEDGTHDRAYEVNCLKRSDI